MDKIPNIIQILMASSLTAAGFLWVSSQRSQQHIEYSGNNPVWMITLLKRYLNLCHRCGIEPVLVFDELDKLEDMEEWWNSRIHEINKAKNYSSDTDENNNKRPPKLDEFLLTLARLKASLGAEFLWVLIGGPNVYSRLRQDRHNRSDGALGMLATTIQQEVLVDPISFESTKQLFEETYSVSVDEQNIKTLWLRSYGNLSTIIRNHEREHYTYHAKTAVLAKRLTEVWHAETQLDYIEFTTDEIWLDKIAEEWVQSWIHTGMLVFANDLLKKPIRYADMRNQLYEHWPDTLEAASSIVIHPEVIALQSEDARLLMALGKQILFAYLTDNDNLSNPQDDESKKEYVEFIIKDEDDTNSSEQTGNTEVTN
ncbi:MAG: hypothetical protein V3V18_15005 [Methylococcales bacterium]